MVENPRLFIHVYRTTHGNVTMMLTLKYQELDSSWWVSWSMIHDPVQLAQQEGHGLFMMSYNICSVAFVALFKQSSLMCSHYLHFDRLEMKPSCIFFAVTWECCWFLSGLPVRSPIFLWINKTSYGDDTLARGTWSSAAIQLPYLSLRQGNPSELNSLKSQGDW